MATREALLGTFAQILDSLYGWTVEEFAKRELFDEVDEDKLTNLVTELDETFFGDSPPDWPYAGSGQDFIDLLVADPDRLEIRFLDESGRWIPPWDR